jgi:hypothetical protein
MRVFQQPARRGGRRHNTAVLPTSRSVQVGSPATAFGTIINSGTVDATGGDIALGTPVPANFA